MSHIKLHILGCGSATPTLRHAPSSQVLELHQKQYMIDCGEGTQLQLQRYKVRLNRIGHIFISHLHGDHCFGLPGLVSSLSLHGRNEGLVVHGPCGLETFLPPILDQFCKEMSFKVEINIIDHERNMLAMEDNYFFVYTIPLKHRVPTCGYLFIEKPKLPHIIPEMIDLYKIPTNEIDGIKHGKHFVTEEGMVISHTKLTTPPAPPKSYAFCSDTAFEPSAASFIQNVDCLYHEATFLSRDSKRAEETFHSTAAQAAEIAKLAKAKQLILGHYSSRYENLDAFLNEARPIFPNVALAQEGGIFHI